MSFPKTRKQVMDYVRKHEPNRFKKVELAQGKGYLYWRGGIADKFHEQNIHVARVSHLQLEKYLEDFRYKCEELIKYESVPIVTKLRRFLKK